MNFNYLQIGQLKTYAKKLVKTNMFSLENWLKNALAYFHITTADPCCQTTESPTRFNESTNTIEYYNQVSNTWDPTPSANSANNLSWDVLGNPNLNSSVNFLGTTDDVDVMLRRNNINAGFINPFTTAFGAQSGNYAQESVYNQSGNTYFGKNTGKDSLGGENTFVGAFAGENNNEFQVVGVGLGAMKNNTGFNATSIGFQSGQDNTGDALCAVGVAAGRFNTGQNVCALGESASESNSGDHVLALGYNAGKNNTLNNVFILGINNLPAFINEAQAQSFLPASGPGGIYIYWDKSDNTLKAR